MAVVLGVAESDMTETDLNRDKVTFSLHKSPSIHLKSTESKNNLLALNFQDKYPRSCPFSQIASLKALLQKCWTFATWHPS